VQGFAASAAAAQVSPWRSLADLVFRPVAPNADLPNALIPVSMTQDTTGFLWLGGGGGLLRWDGYEFRNYPAETSFPDGVRDADVWTLHKDREGRLWAGTQAGGLARYEPSQDRLVCVPLGQTGCGTEHVWSIDDDGKGGIWAATSAGLFHLGPDFKPAAVPHDMSGQGGGRDGEVLAVLRDHNNVLWIGTAHGLARESGGGGAFSPVALPGRPGRAVSRLMEDSAGRIWIGTRQDGAYVIGPERGAARSIDATAPAAADDTAAEVTSLLEIAPGQIWLGTYGRGIVQVDADTLQAKRILHDPFVPNSLDGDSVQSLYRDGSGIVWIGTEDGLSQYNPGAGGIMTFFGKAGRPQGLPGESVMSLLAEPDGSLWAGLQSEGYVLLDPTGRRATGLPGHRVFAIAPAPAGGVLLGTDGGLYLADAAGHHATRLSVPQLTTTSDIRSLRTVNGDVWLAPRDGGLWQLRIDADGKVTVLRHETAPRLTNAVVDVVTATPDGQLAIGTDSGFNLLNLATGAIERITPDPSDPEGFDAGLVVTFATDHRGRLWIGTSNGLDILERRDGAGRPRFRRLGVADGLPNASVDSVIVDKQGRVWAATDMGLAVIDPDTFSVRAWQRADGLAITNYWADSTAQTASGDLVFGGIGGMTMIHSGAVAKRPFNPPVVVTEASVGGRPVPLRQGDYAMLVVLPDANSLSLEFAALDFSAPMRNRYRYRLDGFDTDWVQTDSAHRVATYTNLPPGGYRLRLLGSNSDGVWTTPETTMDIEVLPAWYQTTWFRLAVVATALLLLLAVLRGSTAILRRRQRELQRQVRERTAELSVSQLQLQRANAGLELRVAERTRTLAERTAALEASDARFRAWFNNAEDAVFVVKVEPDGRFVFEAVNPAVERVFGVAASLCPGRQPHEVLPEQAASVVLERYREAVRGGLIEFETRMPFKGGERLLDSWIVPLRNPATGQVDRLIGASRDMTERRALEGRLAQAEKLQALGGLAGGIAHDFNNILQAVAGAAVLIDQTPDDQEKIQRLARSTIAAAERGTSITRRLLAFARSEELRVEAIPTADVLDGLRDVLAYTLGSTITVRADFPATLPPLLADRGQLETAIVNLGTNARDAMPSGGVLTLSAEAVGVEAGGLRPPELAPDDYVRIDVADTGSGMDAPTLARAMEPFFTTKPQGHGTGLGLALVKSFTEQSGGGMVIRSTPGAGTKVSLWLRQATMDVVRPHDPVRVRPPGSASAHVMVVDDDDLVRETIAALLEGAGFSVLAAEGGLDALDLIEAGATPDALVCDLSMPGMNGIDTIKRARGLIPGLACFLLTGYAGERSALETGDAFTLLRKPISASALIAQIEAGLAAVKLC
jgi:PAS domain S-box-containing protein